MQQQLLYYTHYTLHKTLKERQLPTTKLAAAAEEEGHVDVLNFELRVHVPAAATAYCPLKQISGH